MKYIENNSFLESLPLGPKSPKPTFLIAGIVFACLAAIAYHIHASRLRSELEKYKLQSADRPSDPNQIVPGALAHEQIVLNSAENEIQ